MMLNLLTQNMTLDMEEKVKKGDKVGWRKGKSQIFHCLSSGSLTVPSNLKISQHTLQTN